MTEIVNIKAVLIDPFRAEASEVEFDRGDLSAMYALMDCDIIEIPYRTADAELVVDEEGRCKQDNAAFQFCGEVYVGKALLVGPADSEGNFTSVTDAGAALMLGFEKHRVDERSKRQRAEFMAALGEIAAIVVDVPATTTATEDGSK